MMHPFFDNIKSKSLKDNLNSVDCDLFVGDFKYNDNDREIFKKTLERWKREIDRIEEDDN